MMTVQETSCNKFGSNIEQSSHKITTLVRKTNKKTFYLRIWFNNPITKAWSGLKKDKARNHFDP